jgi:hypothetical protein
MISSKFHNPILKAALTLQKPERKEAKVAKIRQNFGPFFQGIESQSD